MFSDITSLLETLLLADESNSFLFSLLPVFCLLLPPFLLFHLVILPDELAKVLRLVLEVFPDVGILLETLLLSDPSVPFFHLFLPSLFLHFFSLLELCLKTLIGGINGDFPDLSHAFSALLLSFLSLHLVEFLHELAVHLSAILHLGDVRSDICRFLEPQLLSDVSIALLGSLPSVSPSSIWPGCRASWSDPFSVSFTVVTPTSSGPRPEVNSASFVLLA